jgi:hypothetical protein
MQLVAYGAQDIYLTGNPMITYFKVVYRRHTNFAMESIVQTFNGTTGWGNRVTALISRNGDLVSGMTLEVTLPNLTSGVANVNNTIRWVNNVGHYLMRQVEVEIGGQLIDRHYDDWLEIWAQLTVPADKRLGYRHMIGQDLRDAGGAAPVVAGTNGNLQGGVTAGAGPVATILTGRKVFVPLQFWFCRNVGLALPLIALQYHEVKVNITFNDVVDLTVQGGTTPNGTRGALTDAQLWVDYIYLDTDERRRFAQVSHEYLIEQLQVNDDTYNAGANKKAINLNFNHPVKELIWVCEETGDVAEPSKYTRTGDAMTALDNFADVNAVGSNPVALANLQLNGHDRFAERAGDYFSRVQPYEHHTCIGSPGINVYSFALKPEEHQPSGTCNFSRIDNAKLNITTVAGTAGGIVRVFATNYNVLRVMSGMGGLAYSN